VEQRPVVKNLSLSNTIKIELVTQLLRDASHNVEIISIGEVDERRCRFYPAFYERTPFHPDISIHYTSSLPIRFLGGFWSSMRTLSFFNKRHQRSPFDVVIIFNLKAPHITCANYAVQCLGLPVIIEYEDDAFVSVVGQGQKGILSKFHHHSYARALKAASGGMAVSPHLLGQLPSNIPKLLLRGVVGDDIVKASEQRRERRNWVLFSGTHTHSNGVAELIQAWEASAPPDWELHITGHGEATPTLRRLAEGKRGIVFHGLVGRNDLVNLLCSAKICVNPHAVSKTPGNVFAFKIIEYLGGGAHVVTTPMGPLDTALEAGITYMPDNTPETIGNTLRDVISGRRWEQNAARSTRDAYGLAAVSKSLNALLQSVCNGATSLR
jgi:hypothetical protein